MVWYACSSACGRNSPPVAPDYRAFSVGQLFHNHTLQSCDVIKAYALLQDFIPAGSGFEDAGQGNKRGASRARSLKRVKLAGTGTATDEKTYLITPVKGLTSHGLLLYPLVILLESF